MATTDRYVTVPKTVTVQGLTWSFRESIRWVRDTDPRFNQTGPGIRAGIRIVDAIKDVADGDVATLDGTDWELLRGVMEAPETPNKMVCPDGSLLMPDGLRQRFTPVGADFISYLDALSDEATKMKPAPNPAARDVVNGAPAETSAS